MRVALTYDDGPTRWTPAILDHLAAHDAKGTFFVCGHAIADHTETIHRMIEEGHEIGVHTWTHPHLTHLSDNDIRAELRTTIVILNTFGIEPKIWRAPYLDVNNRVEAIAEREGLYHIGVTLDPGDWACDDAETITRHVHEHAIHESIVLLHDGIPPDDGSGTKSRQPTVDATGMILAANPLVSFVTVSAL